jgi:hypothetical protein
MLHNYPYFDTQAGSAGTSRCGRWAVGRHACSQQRTTREKAMDLEYVKASLPQLTDAQVQELTRTLADEAQRRTGRQQGAALVQQYLEQRNARAASKENPLTDPNRPWRA